MIHINQIGRLQHFLNSMPNHPLCPTKD
uniref:Uncharacterized protein n=1 Tax=Rhizophora mucronata TaxID=61149 RepID=A0A2P2NU91_RHIMU